MYKLRRLNALLVHIVSLAIRLKKQRVTITLHINMEGFKISVRKITRRHVNIIRNRFEIVNNVKLK